MEIPFAKLQENGNDYILIDEWDHVVIPDEMKAQFAAIYSDRRFGIGGDGIIVLQRSLACDLKMRLFLSDESETGIFGNGVRCLAKYAYDTGYVKESCTVESLAGTIGVKMGYRDEDFLATITMATPLYRRKDIPATGEKGDYLEKIAGFEVHAVNTGAPHAVILTDDVDAIGIAAVAPKIRHHKTFPKGTNVNFVQVIEKDSLRVRTFERGFEGETLSCGTGATASAVIASRLGLAGPVVDVETKGGVLTIHIGDTVKLEGPATTVFSGKITL